MIVGVAFKYKDLIISLPAPNRHNDIFKQLPRNISSVIKPSDQGFITSDGNFLNRNDALNFAVTVGQFKPVTKHKELFSEDLW